MVICSNCGVEVGDSAFCPNCGSKVEIDSSESICPTCGNDVGDGAFCPKCGTKVVGENQKAICPTCGNDVGDDAFCSKCGTKIQKDSSISLYSKSNDNPTDENDWIDDLISLDDKISGKMGKLFSKSKSMDFIFDKTASIGYKNISKSVDNGADRKYYEKIEPVFLEVYDSIDNDYVKAIFMYERSIMAGSGSIAGAIASQVYTPTKDMDHDEAVMFYRNMVNKIISEINEEIQNGTFDEEEFYKKKVKENAINNTSFFGISKSVKAFKKNKK